MKPEEGAKLQEESLGYGPTIIYVPTRKETVSIARFLCELGIKAAAYNAKVFYYHKLLHIVLHGSPVLLLLLFLLEIYLKFDRFVLGEKLKEFPISESWLLDLATNLNA